MVLPGDSNRKNFKKVIVFKYEFGQRLSTSIAEIENFRELLENNSVKYSDNQANESSIKFDL